MLQSMGSKESATTERLNCMNCVGENPQVRFVFASLSQPGTSHTSAPHFSILNA